MLLSLMFRGLLRHRRKGRRLFVLIALGAAGIIFLLDFRSSFSSAYRDLYIGASTGHVEILSTDSMVLQEGLFILKENLPLISIDAETERFVSSLEGVEVSGPIVDAYVSSFNLDGEQEGGYHFVGVDAALRRKLFPVTVPIEGDDDIAWKPGMAEVPMVRPRMYTEFGDRNPDHSVIKLEELRVRGPELETFKARVSSDFPALFPRAPYAGTEKDKDFFADWSAGLAREDLAALAPKPERYSWRVDDALAALEENKDPARRPFLNKRLFKAFYDDTMGKVREPILVGKSVTITAPPARASGEITQPTIMPAVYRGIVQIMPLYGMGISGFADLPAVRSYMKLEPGECTAYILRLADLRDVPRVTAAIRAYLAERGLPYAVADYNRLGAIYQPTSFGIGVISIVLIIVLAAIVGIFVANMVMMSVIKRRREIGTTLAIGLSERQNLFLFLGETAVIVTVSWIAGCAIGGIFVWLGSVFGIPGMIFFPTGKLFLRPDAWSFLAAWVILLPTSLVAALLPLLPLRKALPVDLLKEAR